MFEPTDHPRVFGLPPGSDFPAQLIAGLLTRHAGPPESLARVEIFVNTSRMRRRIIELFAAGPARLLPRLRLIQDIAAITPLSGVAPALPPLRRRLELARLIRRLIEQDPTKAPRAAVFDLADSLGDLMDEMQGEGVSASDLSKLDVSDLSGHWARSLAFIEIVQSYHDANGAPDAEARQRLAVSALAARWQVTPPQHPVIVAGSTGSRGATALLMEAVARLPQGAVILPGFDFEQPGAVWDGMEDALSSEDHPQYRFAKLMQSLDLAPSQIARWTEDDPGSPRNRLISLALRPAPVTDQWMSEGPSLTDLEAATAGITLIEAATPRQEALAIALRLRKAVEDGQVAALVTPDRMLTRRVTAALDRWSLRPDDSAGKPLALSPPGRFLRHVAALFGEKLTTEALLTLLKHPLCNTGGSDRNVHLYWTRELELWLRRKGPPFPDVQTLTGWAAGRDSVQAAVWAGWVADLLTGLDGVGTCNLAEHLERHIGIAERLATGPDGSDTGELWREAAGEKAAEKIAELRREVGAGGPMTTTEYRALFLSLLGDAEVRDAERNHPGVMIWGTLEARVQGADLVILGGLNDGIWPQLPAPDPWLNRRMRQQAGLLLPERRVGLSAHDFQQAIAARQVVVSRATRDAEAETVASRWVNRLTNLLRGLPDTGGPEALAAMRQRGRNWLDMADRLDSDFATVAPQPRPSPRPPENRRPRQLSVTQIKTLIRDPYAIYARHVLGLRALDPLRQTPDAPLRGTVIHTIFERFVRECPDPAADTARDRLLGIAQDVLSAEVPWPTARRIWMAKLTRVVDWFLSGEIERRRNAEPILPMLEKRGAYAVPGTDFTLTGRADRFDLRDDGWLAIYDYKTGAPPSAGEMQYFDKQLLLEAAMAEAGAFPGLAPAPVAEVGYIGLGAKPVFAPLPLRDPDAEVPLDPDATILELRRLLEAYGQRRRGYTSRRAMHKIWNDGDYDHLARFGEWNDSDDPKPEDVG